MIKMMVTILALCSLSLSASALSLPAAHAPEHAYVSDDLSRWSVGFEYESIKRAIDPDGAGSESLLSGDAYALFLGYDANRFLTLFGTLGAARGKVTEWELRNDPGVKFSLGAAGKLWKHDIITPGFMQGRLAIRPSAEYSYYSSEQTESAGDLDWYTVAAAIPLSYTIFREISDLRQLYQTGLDIWAGPAFSYLAGSAERYNMKQDFSGTRELGLVAGIDIYITEQVSIGGHAEIYDEVSANASLRFNF